MKKYNKPEIELKMFNTSDVITASSWSGDEDELPGISFW